MNEAVASSDAMEQDALGSLIQKANIAPGHIPTAPEEKPECVMSQVGCSAEAQPTELSAIQSEAQPEARSDNQPEAQPDDQCHTESVSARSLYPLFGFEAQMFIDLGPR